MYHERLRRFALALVVLCGCAFDGDAFETERVASSRDAIINGIPDTVHHAVVALESEDSSCTGTIIHWRPPEAFVLTAAHCFFQDPMHTVHIGNNWGFPDVSLPIVDFQRHPQSGNPDSTYDFAMVRVSGADSEVPVIGPLAPAEDTLTIGTIVDHVGYGVLSYPNGFTQTRHHATTPLSQLGQIEILYEQPTAGPCAGDSGGPQLVVMPDGSERVAGITSHGDQECNIFGVSGRVSAVYDSFIVPLVGEVPTAVASTTVGGGGAMATSGVGGSSAASGDQWRAPGYEETDLNGEILESGCSTPPTPGDRRDDGGAQPPPTWLALALLVIVRRAA